MHAGAPLQQQILTTELHEHKQHKLRKKIQQHCRVEASYLESKDCKDEGIPGVVCKDVACPQPGCSKMPSQKCLTRGSNPSQLALPSSPRRPFYFHLDANRSPVNPTGEPLRVIEPLATCTGPSVLRETGGGDIYHALSREFSWSAVTSLPWTAGLRASLPNSLSVPQSYHDSLRQ